MALINFSKIGEIAHVQLNRADKRNALSFAMLNELVTIAKKIKKDKTIRVVVISGAGDAFSAGIDLGDLNNPKNMAYAAWELIKPGQSLFQKANLIWQTLPVPVIASLHGYCLGAGMQLALGATGVPESYIIDSRGRIVHQHIGDIRAEDVPDLIRRVKAAK